MIESLRTGTTVHTRGPWEEYATAVAARFGASVDERTRKTLEHGRRIRAALSQPQYSPLTQAEQVALLHALVRRLGFLVLLVAHEAIGLLLVPGTRHEPLSLEEARAYARERTISCMS